MSLSRSMDFTAPILSDRFTATLNNKHACAGNDIGSHSDFNASMFSHHADNPGHDDGAAAAAGSIIPMLAALVIRPALATAVGFMPAMAKAKANSSRMAAVWVPAIIRPMIEDDAANAHLNHGRIAVFDRNNKCYEQAGNQGGTPHHGHGVGTESS